MTNVTLLKNGKRRSLCVTLKQIMCHIFILEYNQFVAWTSFRVINDDDAVVVIIFVVAAIYSNSETFRA